MLLKADLNTGQQTFDVLGVSFAEAAHRVAASGRRCVRLGTKGDRGPLLFETGSLLGLDVVAGLRSLRFDREEYSIGALARWYRRSGNLRRILRAADSQAALLTCGIVNEETPGSQLNASLYAKACSQCFGDAA